MVSEENLYFYPRRNWGHQPSHASPTPALEQPVLLHKRSIFHEEIEDWSGWIPSTNLCSELGLGRPGVRGVCAEIGLVNWGWGNWNRMGPSSAWGLFDCREGTGGLWCEHAGPWPPSSPERKAGREEKIRTILPCGRQRLCRGGLISWPLPQPQDRDDITYHRGWTCFLSTALPAPLQKRRKTPKSFSDGQSESLPDSPAAELEARRWERARKGWRKSHQLSASTLMPWGHIFLYFFCLGGGKQVVTRDPEIHGGTLKPDSLSLIVLLFSLSCKPSRWQHRGSRQPQEPSLCARLEASISTNSHMLLSRGCGNKITVHCCHPWKCTHLQNRALLPSVPSAALSLETLFTPRYARYPKHHRNHHWGP